MKFQMNFKMSLEKLKLSLATLLALSTVSSSALAFEAENAAEAEGVNFATQQVGDHVRILLFKKSVNPQNLMSVYTKLNDDCTFLEDANRPGHAVFDFYWLMDGVRYKPVASAIKSEIRNRLELRPLKNANAFSVAVNDLKQVSTDIPAANWKIDVVSAKTTRGCSVKAFMNLGPSGNNARIHLKEIYTDASANIFTRSVKVRLLKLTGVDAKSGQPVSQSFNGR